jgi:cellulose 1,4-beta-cellobiosidase
VEATTAAGFPATGASQTLYVSTDASRIYRWAGSVYVELGPPVGSSGQPLAAPTAFTAAAGNAQVLLRWTAPAGIITDYRVESSTDSGSTWTIFSQALTAENIEGAFVVLTGLTNGTSYRFRLAAVNSAGRGEYSAASSAVTPSL